MKWLNIYRIKAKSKQCYFIPFIDLKISSMIKSCYILTVHGCHQDIDNVPSVCSYTRSILFTLYLKILNF